MRSRALQYAFLASAALVATSTQNAFAQDEHYSITIHNNNFEPRTLTVKAGVKFQLKVTNASGKTAEFESNELNREKVVSAGANATVFLGPLAPGTYPFFDDFNQSKTGQIVAK